MIAGNGMVKGESSDPTVACTSRERDDILDSCIAVKTITIGLTAWFGSHSE